MTYCSNCGAPLAADARFCPRCGKPVVEEAAPAAVPAAPRARIWWIVPVVIVALLLLGWLILAGLPFGRERERRVEAPPVETIAEGTAPPPAAPRETGTIVDVTETAAPPAPPVVRPREISEGEAAAVLRGFITSRTYYEGVPTQCVELQSSGYSNAGYGFEVWDKCVSGGGSRRLGRWRVDAKTRDVFRQYDDGRYLRP